jgi:hypothetical protein
MRHRVAAMATAGLVAMAGLAAAPDLAAAHKTKLESIAEIDTYLFGPPGRFAGVVGSFDSKLCSRKRLVTVWKSNPGVMDGPVGTAKTNKGGRWSLETTAQPGTYYATVKKRVIRRSAKHRHVCVFDRSENFGISNIPTQAAGLTSHSR